MSLKTTAEMLIALNTDIDRRFYNIATYLSWCDLTAFFIAECRLKTSVLIYGPEGRVNYTIWLHFLTIIFDQDQLQS